MSSEIGLELEKSGNQAEAYLYYLAETKKGNVTAAIVGGLVRTTIQAGDILDLLSYFDEIAQAANLNPDIASLLKARLLVEVGNYHEAHVIQNSLDAATFKKNELVQHFLLKANILAGLQEFSSAI
jgi:thioredoxin-like negative regulator of GroEL